MIVEFIETINGVKVVETFEAEDENSAEQQKQGWQSILNNFKKHVEKKATNKVLLTNKFTAEHGGSDRIS